MSKKTMSESAPEAVPSAPASEPMSPPPPAEPAVDYKSQYEQANDRWLRARAEFDNYRKRVQREYAEIRYQTMQQTIREFLGVYDQLSLALSHAPAAQGAEGLRQGVELIAAEFSRVLTSLGVSQVATTGKPFDPAQHEAVAHVPSADVPAGQIVQEWKAGFLMGDRLLRPAAVTVSAGPAPAVQGGAAEADAGKQ